MTAVEAAEKASIKAILSGKLVAPLGAKLDFFFFCSVL